MKNNIFIIFYIKGKQYKTYIGKKIKIDKIYFNINKKIFLNNILAIGYNNNIKIGNPFIKNLKLLCIIKKHNFYKKIKILKIKRRKNYIKNIGHKQKYTELKIISIQNFKKGVLIGT